ncbi:MAG: hypothetical protein EA374_06270 [Acholeplasmatales bacterium]|nr:MAG: hypothetical protein EA374_06270 [Acholeplasmatales bacterium]
MAKKDKKQDVELITRDEAEDDLETKLGETGQKVGRSVGKALKTSKASVDTVHKRLKQSETLRKTRAKSKEVLEKTKTSLEKTRDNLAKRKATEEDEE